MLTATTQLGFKVRTGGGLPDKVFGVFELDTEETDNETILGEDYRNALRWVLAQNQACEMFNKSFVFRLVRPDSEAECERLYALYLKTIECRAFGLYS